MPRPRFPRREFQVAAHQRQPGGAGNHVESIPLQPVRVHADLTSGFALADVDLDGNLSGRFRDDRQRCTGDLLDVRLQLGRAKPGGPGGLFGNDDLRSRLAVFDEEGFSESLDRERGQAEYE